MTTIERLRKLLEEATSGRWEPTGSPECRLTTPDRLGLTVATFTWGVDADLAGAAKTALPLLLDVAEAAAAYYERPLIPEARALGEALARLEESKP